MTTYIFPRLAEQSNYKTLSNVKNNVEMKKSAAPALSILGATDWELLGKLLM